MSSYADLEAVVSSEDVQRMVEITRRVYVSDPVKEYLVDTVEATRHDPDLLLGASPRATLFLQRASRAIAAADGRDYVSPDDVKSILEPVLNHRLVVRPDAQMRGISVTEVLEEVTATVPVPGTKVNA